MLITKIFSHNKTDNFLNLGLLTNEIILFCGTNIFFMADITRHVQIITNIPK